MPDRASTGSPSADAALDLLDKYRSVREAAAVRFADQGRKAISNWELTWDVAILTIAHYRFTPQHAPDMTFLGSLECIRATAEALALPDPPKKLQNHRRISRKVARRFEKLVSLQPRTAAFDHATDALVMVLWQYAHRLHGRLELMHQKGTNPRTPNKEKHRMTRRVAHVKRIDARVERNRHTGPGREETVVVR